MPTVNMNYEEIRVKYEPQTQAAGLGSDGELVQAVSDPVSEGGERALETEGAVEADEFEFVTGKITGVDRQSADDHDDWMPIDTISPPVRRDTHDTETHHAHITLEEATIASPRVEQLGDDTSDTFLF
ncbi:MAG: hypothetical protein QNJ09_03480 [Paracoccaceae bacterium]|nr:hypothetical protein [Paracoccaceae bacterium]